ncbi:MAG: Holliday junction resolvase RuvX [Planctomycetota bacterium]|nr:Holliday junction resolvase RuvX [Planctomycetota bacterium]
MTDSVTGDPLPKEGRLAGIDFGTRRVGIAICDAGQRLASPLDIYQRGSESDDAQYFQRIVREESLVGLVIGLPVFASGEESEKSQQARAFGQWLSRLAGIPVAFHDERYSTAQAEAALGAASLTKKQRKQRIDKVAAQFILSAYLESARSTEGPGSLD